MNIEEEALNTIWRMSHLTSFITIYTCEGNKWNVIYIQMGCLCILQTPCSDIRLQHNFWLYPQIRDCSVKDEFLQKNKQIEEFMDSPGIKVKSLFNSMLRSKSRGSDILYAENVTWNRWTSWGWNYILPLWNTVEQHTGKWLGMVDGKNWLEFMLEKLSSEALMAKLNNDTENLQEFYLLQAAAHTWPDCFS